MRSKKSRAKRGTLIFLIGILAIPTIHWFVFWLNVNVSSLILAFQTNAGEWSLSNFRIFWEQLNNPYGDTIGRAVINTVKYWAVGIGVVFPLSVLIAYFLFKRIWLFKFFRIMFFFPSIITGVILVSVYSKVIAPYGILDTVLKFFGADYIPKEGFLNNEATATNVILIYCIWVGFGTNVILIGSAMSRIPDSIFEAAKLEGCKPFREVWSLILPLIWPTLSTLILFSLTGFFSSSGPILLFSTDGSAGTTTLAFWIFKQVYGTGEFGVAGGTGNYGLVSATGLVFTVIWVPVILLVRFVFEKIAVVEY